MKNKKVIGIFLVISIAIGAIAVANAGNKSNIEPIGEEPKASSDRNKKIPELNPKTFKDRMEERYEVVEIRGVIPKIKNQDALEKWQKKIDRVVEGDSDEHSWGEFERKMMEKYSPQTILSFGSNFGGYIEVGLNNSNMSEQKITEIYTEIKERANKQGIKNPPVVFTEIDISLTARDDEFNPTIGEADIDHVNSRYIDLM